MFTNDSDVVFRRSAIKCYLFHWKYVDRYFVIHCKLDEIAHALLTSAVDCKLIIL